MPKQQGNGGSRKEASGLGVGGSIRFMAGHFNTVARFCVRWGRGVQLTRSGYALMLQEQHYVMLLIN
jgi:hypothetical protein